jgi:SAM-dependent methyltransferase
MTDTQEQSNVLDMLRQYTLEGNIDERNPLLWQHAETIRAYLTSFELENAGAEIMVPYVTDALSRFLSTLELLPPGRGLRVLELGANPYLFTVLMKRLYEYDLTLANFTSADIYDTSIGETTQRVWSTPFEEEHSFYSHTFNLELSDYPFPDEQFDVVLFCEILEHLVINPLVVFEKLHRIIKPGGHLIITTPNAVRLINVATMLSGSNYFDRYHPQNGVYGRHNREFTLEELEVILINAGFENKRLFTRDRHDYDQIRIWRDNYERPAWIPYSKTLVEAWLKLLRVPTENRGDNLYALAERR